MRLFAKPSTWVDYGLTLPVFLAYHAGIVFLGGVRNGADLVTPWILALTSANMLLYFAFVLGVAALFSLGSYVSARSEKTKSAFEATRFVQVIVEGAVYAFALRLVASFVVGSLLSAVPGSLLGAGILRKSSGFFADVILSLGAGFYEELAFRVISYGLGLRLLLFLFAPRAKAGGAVGAPSWTVFGISFVWMVVVSLAFSAVHYIGPFADKLELASFLFRFVLGLLLTIVYRARGFGVAVWTHALYDLFIVFHL